jgi:hypothetical protein
MNKQKVYLYYSMNPFQDPTNSIIYIAPEKRIKTGQHDLAKIHRQWFNQELEKRERLLRHQPVIIQRIQSDYNKLEDLAAERITLAEEALKLVLFSIWTMKREKKY